MLYRLQSGQRREHDVRVLESMRDNPFSYILALEQYQSSLCAPDDVARENIERRVRESAREGDHSRAELEARRRETSHALAVAAGRQAMQTGSDSLIQQMEARDQIRDTEGMGAAYQRLRDSMPEGSPRIYRQLRLSDYLNEASSDSGSENEEDQEPRGLDALDTGRPEAKSDEELKVSMECRICYTQLSEVVAIPCGHLVMCTYCSDQHSPTLLHDRTKPRRPAQCPVCRKGIKQKYRVYRA
jgi:hypothetical protein